MLSRVQITDRCAIQTVLGTFPPKHALLAIVALRARSSKLTRGAALVCCGDCKSAPQPFVSIVVFHDALGAMPHPAIFALHAATCSNFGVAERQRQIGGYPCFGVTRPNERTAHMHRAPSPKNRFLLTSTALAGGIVAGATDQSGAALAACNVCLEGCGSTSAAQPRRRTRHTRPNVPNDRNYVFAAPLGGS